MIESPLIREIEAKAEARGMAKAATKARQEDVLTCLQARFGRIPRRLANAIQAVDDKRKLTELVALAARCRDVEAFEARLLR